MLVIEADNIAFTVTPYIEGQDLKATLTEANIDDMKYYNSSVGEVPVDELLSFFNILIKFSISTINDMILQKGITLPSVSGVQFNNPQITLKSNYLVVSVDPVYDQQALTAAMRGEYKQKAVETTKRRESKD